MIKIEREQFFKLKGLDPWTCDICGKEQINSLTQICLYGKLHCDKCAHKAMKPWKKERKNVIKEIKRNFAPLNEKTGRYEWNKESIKTLKNTSTNELREFLNKGGE